MNQNIPKPGQRHPDPIAQIHVSVLHNASYLVECQGSVKAYIDPDHVLAAVRNFMVAEVAGDGPVDPTGPTEVL
jgi:hypothetical protein